MSQKVKDNFSLILGEGRYTIFGRNDVFILPDIKTDKKAYTEFCGCVQNAVRQALTKILIRFYVNLLPPATKLGQGNIFSSVCQEFCSQGGSAPLHAGIHPPHPAQCKLGDTGNKRAVRILLECILVGFCVCLGLYVSFGVGQCKRTITMKHWLYFVKLIQPTGHICVVIKILSFILGEVEMVTNRFQSSYPQSHPSRLAFFSCRTDGPRICRADVCSGRHRDAPPQLYHPTLSPHE